MGLITSGETTPARSTSPSTLSPDTTTRTTVSREEVLATRVTRTPLVMLATASVSPVTPSAISQAITLSAMRTTRTTDMAVGPTTSVPGTTVLTTTTSANSTTTTTPVVSLTMPMTLLTKRETEEPDTDMPTSKSSRIPTDVTTVTNTRDPESLTSPTSDTVLPRHSKAPAEASVLRTLADADMVAT